jgi:hypothetical protein
MRSQGRGQAATKSVLVAVGCALAVCACVSAAPNSSGDEGETDNAVTGNAFVAPGEYPSALHISLGSVVESGPLTIREKKGGFSGVKVGERAIMTAAHCVTTGGLTVGRTLAVDQGDGSPTNLTISNIDMERSNPYAATGVYAEWESNDLALIEFTGTVPGTSARILTKKLRREEVVTVVGAGSSDNRLKKADVMVEAVAFKKGVSPKRGGEGCFTVDGDSGAGAFQSDADGQLVLVGILSGCLTIGDSPPTLFTWMSDAVGFLSSHSLCSSEPATAPAATAVPVAAMEFPAVVTLQGCSGVKIARGLIMTTSSCASKSGAEEGRTIKVGRPSGEAELTVKHVFSNDQTPRENGWYDPAVIIQLDAGEGKDIPGTEVHILVSTALMSGETVAVVAGSGTSADSYALTKLDVTLAPDAGDSSELVGASACPTTLEMDGAGAFRTLPDGEMVLVGLGVSCGGGGTELMFTFMHDIAEWLNAGAGIN